MNLTTRRVLNYTLMPQVLPRVQSLVQSGFSFVSFAMACVFETARLLPRNHPYVNPVNFGKFGIHHVLAQVVTNMKFSIRNIDQIIIFLLILGGVVLLAAQIGLMALAMFSGAASAAPLPADFIGFFVSPDPTNDISFMILDRIFGVPDLFDSCVAQNVPCFDNLVSDGVFPEPYHYALQDMLSFYSTGLLVVAVIILAYYVLSIAAEWSQTGSAFGRRFNRAWAPLRLVMALGLLVPITYGLNSAQFITLYIAKWGSGFATNGWNYFLSNLGTDTTLLGDRTTLVALPQTPSPNDILQFFTVVHTCKEAYARVYRDTPIPIDAYIVRTPRAGGAPTDSALPLLDGLAAATGSADPWTYLVDWSDGGDVVIRFGEQDLERYPSQRGAVKPYCGEITITNIGNQVEGAPIQASGSNILLYSYLVYLVDLPWIGNPGDFQGYATRIVDRSVQADENQASAIPTADEMQLALNWYIGAVDGLVQQGYQTQVDDTDWTNDAQKYGWAGAAIWYNKIAQVNGLFTAAVFNLPQPTLYPSLMEEIQEKRRVQNADMSGRYRFAPSLTDGRRVELGDERNYQIAKAMNQAYSIWLDHTPGRQKEVQNVFMDTVYSFFGLTGLIALRENEHIHPLAAMASMGQSMITNAVKNLAWGAATGLFSKVSKTPLTTFAGNFSGFIISIALMGFAIGLVLYYVVPFLPFIYFFFAVIGWAKTVFEAMVGLPLWALAHLRYDGHGFPTQQSLSGYFLLLDIFIRPILIVFGLLGASLIFYACARTLNNTFNIVTSNLTGFDPDAMVKIGAGKMGSMEFRRGPLDQMFFTVMYAMIVYMMGTSCFKLIDLIPNGILRWMNNGAQSLAGMLGGDKGSELLGKSMTGSKQIGGEVGSISQQVLGRNILDDDRNVI